MNRQYLLVIITSVKTNFIYYVSPASEYKVGGVTAVKTNWNHLLSCHLPAGGRGSHWPKARPGIPGPWKLQVCQKFAPVNTTSMMTGPLSVPIHLVPFFYRGIKYLILYKTWLVLLNLFVAKFIKLPLCQLPNTQKTLGKIVRTHCRKGAGEIPASHDHGHDSPLLTDGPSGLVWESATRCSTQTFTDKWHSGRGSRTNCKQLGIHLARKRSECEALFSLVSQRLHRSPLGALGSPRRGCVAVCRMSRHEGELINSAYWAASLAASLAENIIKSEGCCASSRVVRACASTYSLAVGSCRTHMVPHVS